jgi:hypothetical protein
MFFKSMIDYGQAKILENLNEVYKNSKPILFFLRGLSLETILLFPLFFREETAKTVNNLKEFFSEKYFNKSEHYDRYL